MPVLDNLLLRLGTFSLTGLLNTGIGFLVILCGGLLGLSPLIANALGYAVGLIISFTLNSTLTFRGRERNQSTVIRFLVAFAFSYSANVLTVLVVTRLLPLHHLISSLVGLPVYTLVFFTLCETWVYASRGHSP